MNRKPKDPPKAVFTNRRISICGLEKPKSGVSKDWIEELDAVERRIKHFVSLDTNRIRKICDDSNEFQRLCNVLQLEIPREEPGPDMKFSLHKFPLPKRRTGNKKRFLMESPFDEEEVEEESSTNTSSNDITDPEFRKTLFESAMVRASEKKSHVSPYKVEWSIESSERSGQELSVKSEVSSGHSMETIGHLSEDLFVNPPKSQITELLEPLEEAKSPYQKFFTRSAKEIREHVERLRKKRFHTHSEKCIEDFVKFLDENDLRSPKVTSETLNNLFTIDVASPAEKAFCLDPHELPSVPKEIADLYNEPHSSKRAGLHQQIMWDMIYEKGKERKLAFGSLLPKVRKPWNRNTRERWFQPPGLDWDSITGKDLWKDLLDTEILEDFGKWLMENPDYPKPDYLVRIGFFEHLKEKAIKETEIISLPVRDEEHFLSFINKMERPLSLLEDDERFKKLPRYDELKEQALDRVITQEGIEEFDGKAYLASLQ
ncbi:uncharacterized protein [Halyomorpha halys]|uniref:uncharacterized protein n=1 Tax=Halyomorpha halys TaxID=286706 RepID=UPI0006D4FE60|nr:uncharacterized protein LOC106680557 [Halyomorpha halys]